MAESIPWAFGISPGKPVPSVPLLLDNTAALLTANHPRTTAASKHIDIRHFRIRDAQGEDGHIARIRCYWIPTAFNPADHFSKLLKSVAFRRLTRFMVNNKYDSNDDATATYHHRHINDPSFRPELYAYFVDSSYDYQHYLNLSSHSSADLNQPQYSLQYYLNNDRQIAPYYCNHSDLFSLPDDHYQPSCQ